MTKRPRRAVALDSGKPGAGDMTNEHDVEWTTTPVDQAPMPPATRPRPTAPPPMTLAPPLPERRSSLSRHGSGGSRKQVRRLKWLVALLLVAIAVGAVLGTFGFGQLQRFRNEANTLATQARQLERDLASARDRISEMGTDLRVLLANRIPGIAQISYGRPLEINDRYVRSLTFARRGKVEKRNIASSIVIQDSPAIEYSIVLQNTRSEPVLPKVRILLFDDSGLQTGAVSVTTENSLSPVTTEELQPGETRTHAGRIPLERLSPSTYYLMEVE